MAKHPKRPLYLYYGNQCDAILGARDAVLGDILTPETRDQNLTEYYPTGNQPIVKLTDILEEIAGDLATMSFFPDATKCVVVTNPAELMGSARRPPAKGRTTRKSKSAGAGAEPRLHQWIEHELPRTGHHLMLLCFEDEADGREVNEKAALYQAAMRVGHVQRFRETKAFFRIEDGIAAGNATACLRAVRDLWKTGKGDSFAYGAVVRALRFLMQANIARDRGSLKDPALQGRLFPADRQRNLFLAAPNVRRKYLAPSVKYRTGDLLRAYGELLDVYRALRPRPGDVYVADALGLLEQTLLRLFAVARRLER